MNFLFIKIFYIVSFLFNGMPIKVFNFHETNKHEHTNSETFSTMTLRNVPTENLPKIFTICSTHQQSEWNTPNTHHIYTVYEDANYTKPWFSIGFWERRTFWARIDTIWYNIGNILPLAMTQDMITICIEINDRDSTISSSIGGHSAAVQNIAKMPDQMPRFFLKLGLCDEILEQDFPFYGKIAKIRKEYLSFRKIEYLFLFKRKIYFNSKLFDILVYISLLKKGNQNLTEMSKNLCSYDSTGSDAIISWESMEWDVHGGEVSNQTIEETKLCHSDGDHTSYGDFLSLRMPPSSWSWSTGYNACKQVGQMYDDFVEADQERRKNGRKVFENLGAYEYVWTSLQYINESKEIINLNSNITSDYRYD